LFQNFETSDADPFGCRLKGPLEFTGRLR